LKRLARLPHGQIPGPHSKQARTKVAAQPKAHHWEDGVEKFRQSERRNLQASRGSMRSEEIRQGVRKVCDRSPQLRVQSGVQRHLWQVNFEKRQPLLKFDRSLALVRGTFSTILSKTNERGRRAKARHLDFINNASRDDGGDGCALERTAVEG
jgi:hypothetical protein